MIRSPTGWWCRRRNSSEGGGVIYSQPNWASSLREAAGGRFDAVIDSWGADGWPEALRVSDPLPADRGCSSSASSPNAIR